MKASGASLTLTASALAPPSGAGIRRDDVYDYVRELLRWKEALRDGWLEIFLREDAVTILHDEGLYPLPPVLTQLLASHAIEEFDAPTVQMAARGLVERQGTFEEHFGVRLILFDEGALVAKPDLPHGCSCLGLARDATQTMAAVSFAKQKGLDDADSHSVVLRPCEGNCEVSVSMAVHAVEWASGECDEYAPPLVIENEVSSSPCFGSWARASDELKLWCSSSDSAPRRAAIRLRTFKMAGELGSPVAWEKTGAFVFGDAFLAAADQCCRTPTHVKELLRAMSEALLGAQMKDVHSLRKGSGPNEPQRTRGLDKAWRRDIDRDLHLHYWGCAGGVVEFACVGHHNSMSIPS